MFRHSACNISTNLLQTPPKMRSRLPQETPRYPKMAPRWRQDPSKTLFQGQFEAIRHPKTWFQGQLGAQGLPEAIETLVSAEITPRPD